jgi:sigma-B regulation protein RsbU (phosphoserine phosphatase)
VIAAPKPADEAERLADLRALKILDTPPEERFDRIVRLAGRIFDVPMAYLSLIDAERQWFKAKCGIPTESTGRDISFCGHAILGRQPLIIPDATQDERFRDNPLVVGEPYIRFYAGHPLAGPGGSNVGTLCLADTRPRSLDDRQRQILRQLAALAEHELKLVNLIEVQRELIETKSALVEAQGRLAEELAQAAAYVRSLLPPRLAGPVRTDWQFVSSSQLGGDVFGYDWIDDRHLSVYLLDVCGHGVGAALLSIAVHTALRRRTLPGIDFGDPSAVLASLNRTFPMEEHDGRFFTIWYGVYDRTGRSLRYASAGHPPALLFNGHGQPPARLGASDLMIGVVPEALYATESRPMSPGSRLYVFSDGVTESPGRNGALLGHDGLAEIIAQASPANGQRLDQVLNHVRCLQGADEFRDDVSLVEVEFD